MKPDETEILEDLVVAAAQDAKASSRSSCRRRCRSMTGGLPLPPGSSCSKRAAPMPALARLEPLRRPARAALLSMIFMMSLAAASKEATMTLRITSPAFADGATIPAKYTCEGSDLSPPLAWSGVPDGHQEPRAHHRRSRCARSKGPTHDVGPLGALRLAAECHGLAEAPMRTDYRPAPRSASTTGSAPTTAARARPSAGTAISTSSMRSTPSSRRSSKPTQSRTSRRRCAGTCCAEAQIIGTYQKAKAK